ncbi:hypothetical protein BOTBODRAFT_31568 [Botryobasidium botryosum FD-172 SS1]|uniref:F-box domain-containing protein n=1 Tax=Botryobasidium botryosum (strain FD-172 SS1) TaxID=930990 RepID=A0A067MLS8_BOTB1|nr:hypothetical protein BOTBODRAFT_31568 [Botryobasidium botryosum FD-172 SS1]
MSSAANPSFLGLPSEILLHIMGYLDLPDQQALSRLSLHLSRLSSDPALHRVRIRVVAPSRVDHSLSCSNRPAFDELVKRGFVRGLGIERRLRTGGYVYSPQSVYQYRMSEALRMRKLRSTVAGILHARPVNPLHTLHSSRVLPDVESSSPFVSRSLLPVMHKLKWSLRRDELARKMVGARSPFDLLGHDD